MLVVHAPPLALLAATPAAGPAAGGSLVRVRAEGHGETMALECVFGVDGGSWAWHGAVAALRDRFRPGEHVCRVPAVPSWVVSHAGGLPLAATLALRQPDHFVGVRIEARHLPASSAAGGPTAAELAWVEAALDGVLAHSVWAAPLRALSSLGVPYRHADGRFSWAAELEKGWALLGQWAQPRAIDASTLAQLSRGVRHSPLLLVKASASLGAAPLNFSFCAEPTLDAAWPERGPASGGTALTVRGSGFACLSATGAAACRFGRSAVPATVVNDTTILCKSIASGYTLRRWPPVALPK